MEAFIILKFALGEPDVNVRFRTENYGVESNFNLHGECTDKEIRRNKKGKIDGYTFGCQFVAKPKETKKP